MGRVLLVVILLAAVVYACMWLLERRRVGLPLRPKRGPAPPPRRTTAPDDDEDFLRWLERKRRHDTDSPD